MPGKIFGQARPQKKLLHLVSCRTLDPAAGTDQESTNSAQILGMYEDVILLTLQLLYYRSWVSRIKYTHVKAGTF
jgi:hypothetical protein